MVSLVFAVFATLAWSFLPDGPVRGADRGGQPPVGGDEADHGSEHEPEDFIDPAEYAEVKPASSRIVALRSARASSLGKPSMWWKNVTSTGGLKLGSMCPTADGKVNGRIDVTSLSHIDLQGIFRMGTDYPGSPNIQADLARLPMDDAATLAAATRVWRDFFANPEEVYTEGYRYIRDCWDGA